MGILYSNMLNYDTVNHVDLQKYSGQWFELIRNTNFFENQNDEDIKAEYELIGDHVKVINSCIRNEKTLLGDTYKCMHVRYGNAYPRDTSNSKLTIYFEGVPFPGDYQIVFLDDNYNFAIVASPLTKNFWVLSRIKVLPPNILEELHKWLDDHEYNSSDIIFTKFNPISPKSL